MMMRNTVAKLPTNLQNFGVARTHYRNNSSMSEKDVLLGDLDLFVDNIAGLFYKGALGVVGFVVGGLAAPRITKENEMTLIEITQVNDERDIRIERMRKKQEEFNRLYYSKRISRK